VLSFVNAQDLGPETTPLHEAAIRGSSVREAFEELEMPATDAVNMPDATGRTPLYRATFHGHYNAVQQLIDAGADVNDQDVTPLMVAALNDRVEIMQHLLSTDRRTNKTRCHINQQNKYGRTALHHAAQYSHFRAIQLLLEKGADTSARDSSGQTPLHQAIISKAKCIGSSMSIKGTLHLLLNAKHVNINAQHINRITLFIIAIIQNTSITVRWLKNIYKFGERTFREPDMFEDDKYSSEDSEKATSPSGAPDIGEEEPVSQN
ncbi:unnamed protein product, partial [Clonostachys solani]